MSGGEYRVDAYYETVKRKMKKVRDDLERVRKERALRREHRERRGFCHVSIAGYANAGKSSLFNTLSGEQVLVEDRLFTTLSTTTRAIDHPARRILLTDTVGFVSDVPLWLVEAFHSTLEEVYASDLVLLLADASDSLDDFRSKFELAADTLIPGMDAGKVVPVLTKVDSVTLTELERRLEAARDTPFTRPPMCVSSRTGTGIEDLRRFLHEEFRYPIELTVRVPQDSGAAPFLNWLHEQTDVVAKAYTGSVVELRLRCRERDLTRIQRDAIIVSGPGPVTSD